MVAEPRQWNGLVVQKDAHYSSAFMTATRHLQKKFVGLFAFGVPINDSYCAGFLDWPRPGQLGFANRNATVSQTEHSQPNVEVEILSAGLDQMTTQELADISLSSVPATPDGPIMGDSALQSQCWATPPQTLLRGSLNYSSDSDMDSAWGTPATVLVVPDPNISNFSSLASYSDGHPGLDITFVGSPDLSPVPGLDMDLSRSLELGLDPFSSLDQSSILANSSELFQMWTRSGRLLSPVHWECRILRTPLARRAISLRTSLDLGPEMQPGQLSSVLHNLPTGPQLPISAVIPVLELHVVIYFIVLVGSSFWP